MGGYRIEWYNEGPPVAPPPDPFEDFLNNPEAVSTFKLQLNTLQRSFVAPVEWRDIDPTIAMLLHYRYVPYSIYCNPD